MTSTNLVGLSKWLAISKVCDLFYAKNKQDCKFFVKAVSSYIGVTDFDSCTYADDICKVVRRPPWKSLRDGVAAARAAWAGEFVIANMLGTEILGGSKNGHVAIIMPTTPGDDGIPYGYAGSLSGYSIANQKISNTFYSSDVKENKVIYSSLSIGNRFSSK